MDGKTWISDDIPTSSFLLEVDFEEDLTDSSSTVRDTNPTLCTTFVHELRMFAVAHGHAHEAPKAQRKANTNAKPAGKNTNAKPAGKQPQTEAKKRARGEGPSKAAQRPRRHT